MKKFIKNATIFLHSDKLRMLELGEECGLNGEPLDFFKYACSEIALDISIYDDGSYSINSIDSRKVE